MSLYHAMISSEEKQPISTNNKLSSRKLSKRSSVSKFGRCHTRLAIEELGEERGIGEVQVFSDLPDRQIAVFQLQLGLLDDVSVNPLHGCLSADFPDDGSKMVGCQAETVGIESDGVFTSGMLVDKNGKAMKNILLTTDGTTLSFCVFFIIYKMEFGEKRRLQGPDRGK